MLLLIVLAVAQGPAEPQHDLLTSYLAVAAAYGSAQPAGALQEIRQWPLPQIAGAVNQLQRQAKRLRWAPSAPHDIAFRTVEAAVLMHAEAGLLALQSLSMAEADAHLRASTDLVVWSRVAAAEARNFARMGAHLDARHERSPGPEIRERIDRRDFYLALAASALTLGFPSTAIPFAEKARQAAPLDPDVQLVFGCVAESLAEEKLLRHRESEASPLRDQAVGAFRDALALEPGLHEALLRLGRLLLVGGRLIEAEPLLEDVDRRSEDKRQRYLARLFLGRLAERRDRHGDAVLFYARALASWPDSQAARLALAHVLERESGPAAARPLVAATLSAARRLDRATDPWWLYPFGPPRLAGAALDRLWMQVLGR